jgi:hypothetical protein
VQVNAQMVTAKPQFNVKHRAPAQPARIVALGLNARMEYAPPLARLLVHAHPTLNAAQVTTATSLCSAQSPALLPATALRTPTAAADLHA